jgi:pilus assembly protein CpaC
VGDTVILEGIVFSEADALRAVELAKVRVPNVRNLLSIQKLIIETDVQFVQVTSDGSTDTGYNVLKSLGIGAQGAAQGGGGGNPALSWGAGASASARINAVIGEGRGKVVAHNNISTTSGTEGDTMVGGEFGISVAGNVGGSLEKIQFGLMLKVKPVLQGRDSIVSAVTFEMSVPVGRAQGTTAYTLEKSKTSTTVMCKAGESVVLSGLAQALGTSSREKTPLLGDIPVLNLLFSEKSTRKEKKDVIVVLTSRLIKPEVDNNTPFSEERKKLLEVKDVTK